MGFDHVLVAPIFAPGRVADIFLIGDGTRIHPALGWSGDAQSAIALVAKMCRARGLTLLLDLVVDRVADGSALLANNAPLFERADGLAALDPRRSHGGFGAVHARWDDPAAVLDLAALWARIVLDWAAAGLGGVRIECLRGVPAAGLRALVDAVRREAPGFAFLGWTPGLPHDRLPGLRGTGLDYVFSSLPWWNFRDVWLWQETALLRGLAPIVAAPEAPFGRRLAAGWYDPTLLQAAYRRALACASLLHTAWLMPMGFEYGTARPMRGRRGTPADFAAIRDEAPFDLSAEITALNAMRLERPELSGSGETRLLTGTGAEVIAALRTTAPDLRAGGPASLVVVNTDVEAPREIGVASLLPGAGAALAGFGDGGATWRPGDTLRLAPAETQLLQAIPATPVKWPTPPPSEGAREAAAAPRIAIEAVTPCVDDGALPARRLLGESVTVQADLICDGHDMLAAAVLWRAGDEADWAEARMRPIGNDRWQAEIPLRRLGRTQFTIEAWRDAFATYRDELAKKHAAGLDLTLELEEGRLLVRRALERNDGTLRDALAELSRRLEMEDPEARRLTLMDDATSRLMQTADDRPFRVRHHPPLAIEVDRTAAAFAGWYELFPRSMSDDASRHGTFADVIRHLPRIRDMGFDVLYFPPIHPIGRRHRKGRNNTVLAAAEDPGSPYAIGGTEGGHDAIHPELGTLDDFRRMRDAALDHGLELALDFAIQTSPDHPWLTQHREWFDWRPDGSLRYAENPPKKYEDIVNVDFYTAGAVPSLWVALRDVVLFWLAEGVRIFRVDNPHTKPLPFWHWLITEVRARDPGAIFLAEAFTRPKMMSRLAKIGFSQSYTYFTWRNAKAELQAYFTELNSTPMREYFRPHLFVNTPDINPYFLQESGRAGFLIRAALACTLSGLWGIYCGFELCEATPLPGREEYLDSEKYQLRAWDWNRPGNIAGEIASLNRLRRHNPALQTHLGLRFYNAFNDTILYYGKLTPDRSNVVVVAVSLDPHNVQEADVEIPLWEWNIPDDGSLRAEDLMDGRSFVLHGKRQHLRLDPAGRPFAIWRLSPLR